jgi:hypothetical protein
MFAGQYMGDVSWGTARGPQHPGTDSGPVLTFYN